MEREAVLNQVKQIVADHFDLDGDTLSGATNLMNDIDADSIDFVELVLEMEDQFDAEISDEAAAELVTIDNVVDYIVAHAG